ncbi:MAG: hypothetical protein P1V97_06475, partial [Planctomycetota bacterium]|nr:hypothetical protein [Planctomycetota bacterium]
MTLRKLALILCITTLTATLSAEPEKTRPIVIAHRGASGY